MTKNKIKFWLLMMVAMIGIVLLIFLPKKTNKTNEEIQQTKLENLVKDVYLPVELANPKKVNYDFSDEVSINMPQIKPVGSVSNEVLYKWLGFFGLSEKDIFENNQQIVFYRKDGVSEGYYSKNLKKMSITKTYDTKKLAIRTRKKIDLLRIETEEKLERLSNLKIVWNKTSLKKIIPPRWVEASENDYSVVELEGNFSINNKEIMSYYGNSIKVTVAMDGEIIKAEIFLIPELISGEEIKTLTTNQLKEITVNNIGIFEYGGDKNFELNIDDLNTDLVNIVDIRPVYVFDGRRNSVEVYYQLSGNAMGKTPLTLKLLTRAFY